MSSEQRLIGQFLKNHPEIAIGAIEELSTDVICPLIESLSREDGLAILADLNIQKAAKVLEIMPFEAAIYYFEHLPFHTSMSILRVTNESLKAQVLKMLPEEYSKKIRRSLFYDKNTVGAHIHPNVITLYLETTIEKAFKIIQNSADQTSHNVYVLDNERKLVGYVTAFLLLTVETSKLIKSVMKPIPALIPAEMNVKDALENWKESFYELPVLTAQGEFLGIITKQMLAHESYQSTPSDHSVIKAGNALADLYKIGLTSLLGGSDRT